MNDIVVDIVRSNMRMSNISYDYFYFELCGERYITKYVKEGVESIWEDSFDSTQFDVNVGEKNY